MNKIVYILFLTFIVANDAPVWTDIPNQTIEEDCNPCIGFPIDLNQYVSDIHQIIFYTIPNVSI